MGEQNTKMNEALKKQLLAQLNGLRQEVVAKSKAGHRCHWTVGESLNYIRSRTLELLDSETIEVFENTVHPLEFTKPKKGDSGVWLIEGSEAYKLMNQLDVALGNTSRDAASVIEIGKPADQPNNKVFIVHGHDEIAKSSLEIFLTEIGLQPIVLHRQADEGLTIIEKFEKHSDVGFAFILLTPDEVSYLASEASADDADRKKEFRARPNVIFEFGYFVGKLGRARVCCLHTGNVTLPSNITGLIYKSYSSRIEEVGYSLLKDLAAAGYRVGL